MRDAKRVVNETQRAPQTRQEWATAALTHFQRGERVSSDTTRAIWTHDHTEEWVQDLVHAAHDEMLPDDFRYEMIHDALTMISEAESDDDLDEREGDLEAPIYNSELIRWLGSHGYRPDYCEEAREEFGGEPGSLMDQIALGYMYEFRKVCGLVRAFLEKLADE